MKAITKEYLISSLKNFNESVLSHIYAKIPKNKSTLDKIGESGGSLTFNGNSIGLKGEDGFSPVIDVETLDDGHKVTITDATHTEEFIIRDGVDGGGGGIPVNPPTGISITNLDEAALIKWTDPSDVVYESATIGKWSGTVVVRKAGSEPLEKSDGVIVVDSRVRNKYQTDGFIDNGLTNEVEYYYGIFPYTSSGQYTTDIVQSFTPEIIYPNAVTLTKFTYGDGAFTIEYNSDSTVSHVKCVYRTESAPENSSDGIVINDFKSGDTISGLDENITYYFKLYSVNVKSRESESITFSGKSTWIYSPPITNVVLTGENDTVTVTFDTDLTTTRVKCVYKAGSEPTDSSDGITIDNFASGNIITGLDSTADYYFKFYNYNENGRETVSNTVYKYSAISPVKIVTWKNGTDDEILAMIDAHYNNQINISDYWAVGDTRSILLEGVPYWFAILDFDHDKLSESINGHTKAAVTIGMVDLLPEPYQMNETCSSSINWSNSSLKTTMNDVMINWFNPTFKDGIKEVRKEFKLYNYGTPHEYNLKLWFLGTREILSSSTLKEGNLYPYYATSSHLLKKANGTLHDWWIRSHSGTPLTNETVMSVTTNINQYGIAIIKTNNPTTYNYICINVCL